MRLGRIIKDFYGGDLGNSVNSSLTSMQHKNKNLLKITTDIIKR